MTLLRKKARYFNNNLLDSDAGDESSGPNFNFNTYNVLNYITASNTVKFMRGEEAYIHPTLAILKATYKPGYGEDNDYIYYNTNCWNQNNEMGISNELILLYIEITIIISIIVILFYGQYRWKRKKKK